MRVELKGSSMSPNLVKALHARGIDPDPRRTYSLATSGYTAGEAAAELLGQVDSHEPGPPLRDLLSAYLKKRGFPAAG